MRKLMHNILFENAEIISGILSIYILCGIIFPFLESIITYKTSISLIFIIAITAFIITIAIFFISSFLFEEYCYDQKTSNEKWEKNKYKS